MPNRSSFATVGVVAGIVLLVGVVAAVRERAAAPADPVEADTVGAVAPARAGPAQEAAVFFPLPDAVAVDEAAALVTIARPDLPSGGTIVYAHGGGWVEGAAHDVRPEFRLGEHAGTGWTVLALEYRLAALATGVRAEDQVRDLTAALRWLAESGPGHGLDGPVVVVGHSAGAHLATVAAAREPDLVDAVVGIAGVYDTADDVRSNPWLAEALPAAVGCGVCRDVLPEPATGASSEDPPVWIVHGTADPIAPPASAGRYADALAAVGVPVTLELVPDVGHAGEELGEAARAAIAAALSAEA